jgi:hypothetical protein
MMTDIDHILTQATIDRALAFCGDKMVFERRFGILDENGVLVDDPDVLAQWGLKAKSCKPHPNTFVMKQSWFWRLGGFATRKQEEDDKGVSDRVFNARYRMGVLEHECETPEICPEPVYVFPTKRFCGAEDFNPFGFFHKL